MLQKILLDAAAITDSDSSAATFRARTQSSTAAYIESNSLISASMRQRAMRRSAFSLD
jgi:hypothetical protein